MADALPSLSELIERALASNDARTVTSMPGEIVSYDPATQRATVKPCLRAVVLNTDDGQTPEDLPPIQNVPVVWPGGSGLTLHGTLSPGDTGDIQISSWSHNEWKGSGNVSTPGDLTPHPMHSAKFYPGLRHDKNAAPDADNSIGKPGGQRLHFTALGASMGTGGQAVVLATALASALASACGAAISAAVPNDGGKAAFGALQSALASASYGAGNLKADP